MRKFILLLIFSFTTAFSQSTESLKIATTKFYQANYLLDFDGIAFLNYPKIVEKIGAENIQDILEEYYENDVYRLRLQLETVPFQYGEIRKIEGKSFCVITFRNPMRYFFGDKLTNETVIEKALWLKEVNKTKEVTFEPKRNSFNVRKTTTFVAITDEATNNEWKFFNLDDPSQNEVFYTFFSESLKKELGL